MLAPEQTTSIWSNKYLLSALTFVLGVFVTPAIKKWWKSRGDLHDIRNEAYGRLAELCFSTFMFTRDQKPEKSAPMSGTENSQADGEVTHLLVQIFYESANRDLYLPIFKKFESKSDKPAEKIAIAKIMAALDKLPGTEASDAINRKALLTFSATLWNQVQIAAFDDKLLLSRMKQYSSDYLVQQTKSNGLFLQSAIQEMQQIGDRVDTLSREHGSALATLRESLNAAQQSTVEAHKQAEEKVVNFGKP